MKENDDLSRTIYEKTWKGEYWGQGGVIELSWGRYTKLLDIGKRPEALSALSSTYYSACGQAVARFRASFNPVWLFRAWWCLRQAGKLSDELERLLSLDLMSPEQLDIRARILFRQRRYALSKQVTQEALGRDGLMPDTRALLEMGLAEISDQEREPAGAQLAYGRALFEEENLRPTTTVRIYASLTRYHTRWMQWRLAQTAAEKALAIAQTHGLEDQAIKLQPVLEIIVRKMRKRR